MKKERRGAMVRSWNLLSLAASQLARYIDGSVSEREIVSLGKEEANMAKRVMDRRALRAQADAVERLDAEPEGQETETSLVGDEASSSKPQKPAKAKEKGPPKPRKTKARAAKVPLRMRFVWTIFTNSYQPVAKFDYANKAEAEAQAARLTTEKRVPHFVIAVKEPMEEEA